MRIATTTTLLACLFTAPLLAAPTGSPLVVQPVQPCRVLDTRVTLGALPDGTAMDVHVRGAALPSDQGGASDCGIPAEAEAAILIVHALAPTTAGYLRVSGTGSANGVYARMVYNALELDSVEMTVNLCNVKLFPSDHIPCPGTSSGLYEDAQIINTATTGSSTHIAVDVVGYLKRMPLTAAVAGEVINKEGTLPGPITLVLASGLGLVCDAPYTEVEICDEVQIGWGIRAAGHVVNNNGSIFIYAHNEIGVDQN